MTAAAFMKADHTNDLPLPLLGIASSSPNRRKPRIGLVAGGLGTYWPQFPDLLPQLQESARYVSERFAAMDAEVTDVGFISDAQEGVVAAETLRQADCDLIVLFLTTYLTSSMVLPIAQRSGALSSLSTFSRASVWTMPPSTPGRGWPTAVSARP